MRLTGTLLTTILAVLVISEAGPQPSGLTTMLPCEAAPRLLPAPTVVKPQAPTNLRILGGGGLEDLVEDLLASGPNAGPEPDYLESATRSLSPAIVDAHSYYATLASRGDCFAAYSLRDAAQVEQYRAPQPMPADMRYTYSNDPDRRKQDAMKIIVREGTMGPNSHLRLPIGPSSGKNLLITVDYWMGNEFNKGYSKLEGFKEWPLAIFRSGDVSWAGMRADFGNPLIHTHNLPPGGPYVTMAYPQAIGKAGIIKTDQYGGDNWMDSMTGYPRVRLPYTAPAGETRAYVEAMAPFDSSVYAPGVEIGVVAERWTRYWLYFERAPSKDWVSSHPSYAGQQMSAYKWSLWFADTVRPAQRVLDEAVIGIPSALSNQIVSARMQMGSGNANIDSKYVGRGDLVGYARNVVVLHGISKADVGALLVKPVN